jgi:hypothetical protein
MPGPRDESGTYLAGIHSSMLSHHFLFGVSRSGSHCRQEGEQRSGSEQAPNKQPVSLPTMAVAWRSQMW